MRRCVHSKMSLPEPLTPAALYVGGKSKCICVDKGKKVYGGISYNWERRPGQLICSLLTSTRGAAPLSLSLTEDKNKCSIRPLPKWTQAKGKGNTSEKSMWQCLFQSGKEIHSLAPDYFLLSSPSLRPSLSLHLNYE